MKDVANSGWHGGLKGVKQIGASDVCEIRFALGWMKPYERPNHVTVGVFRTARLLCPKMFVQVQNTTCGILLVLSRE